MKRILGKNRIARSGTATLLSCLAGLLLVGFGSASPAGADSIVVLVSNGNPTAAGIEVSSADYAQESWTQNAGHTNVSISAWLFAPIGPNGFLTEPGTAYLTSSVPGAPELVQTFVFPTPPTLTTDAVSLTLFSGLTLPAGTYFLTLASTNLQGGGWADCFEQPIPPCTVTLADGVSLANGSYSHSSLLDPANPALSGFISAVPDRPFMFAVTGAAVTTPEPGSIILSGSGCLILGLMILGRRRFAN